MKNRLLFTAMFSVFLIFSSCFASRHTIGYVGSITGKYASMGISGRNAAELAIREYNESRTFFEKEIVLSVRDYSESSSPIEESVEELKKENISVLINQLTSSPGIRLIEQFKGTPVLIISSSVSSKKISRMDDYVIRTTGDTSFIGQTSAKLIRNDGVKTIAILFDPVNADYSLPMADSFKINFTQAGCRVISEIPIDDKSKTRYQQIALNLEKIRPDGIFFIASGIDSGMLTQVIKSRGIPARLYGSSWTKTSDYIPHSGRYGEGTRMINIFEYQEGRYPDRYAAYVKKYQVQYNKSNNFFSDYTYELTEILIEAIRKTNSTNAEKLKKYILNQSRFDALMGSFTLDAYGDCSRDLGLSEVKNGQYIILK